MPPSRAALCTLLAALLATACGIGDGPEDVRPLPAAREGGRARLLDVRRIASGLDRPTWVGVAPGDRALWVLEQPGRVLRLRRDRRQLALDLTAGVRAGGEQGLLGIAFHPAYAANRRVFLHWSDRVGDTRVAEFRARADGRIEPRPVRQLLHVHQPEENHNGGQLAFGPDDRLYLGLGDGGGAFDPRRTAQDPESRLGKLLSTDVDARRPDWRVELTGLRNPWRFAFDPALGEVWLGDVGQDRAEEIDRVLLEPDEPPKNLGWGAYEGTERVPGDHELEGPGEVVWPVATYGHRDGCSVTGGVVYRGTRLRRLAGRYVYGDFCTGSLWSLRGTPDGRARNVRRERAQVPQLTHIGTDGDGELLFASATGSIYRGVPVSRAGAR